MARVIASLDVRRDPAERRELSFGGLLVESGVTFEPVDMPGNTCHVPVNQLTRRVVCAWRFVSNPARDVDIDAEGDIVERHGVVDSKLWVAFCRPTSLVVRVTCGSQS
jgi:hypothetical protein